jgi:hypothetical protein
MYQFCYYANRLYAQVCILGKAKISHHSRLIIFYENIDRSWNAESSANVFDSWLSWCEVRALDTHVSMFGGIHHSLPRRHLQAPPVKNQKSAPPRFLIGNLETNWDGGDETSWRRCQRRNQVGTRSAVLIGALIFTFLKEQTCPSNEPNFGRIHLAGQYLYAWPRCIS